MRVSRLAVASGGVAGVRRGPAVTLLASGVSLPLVAYLSSSFRSEEGGGGAFLRPGGESWPRQAGPRFNEENYNSQWGDGVG